MKFTKPQIPESVFREYAEKTARVPRIGQRVGDTVTATTTKIVKIPFSVAGRFEEVHGVYESENACTRPTKRGNPVNPVKGNWREVPGSADVMRFRREVQIHPPRAVWDGAKWVSPDTFNATHPAIRPNTPAGDNAWRAERHARRNTVPASTPNAKYRVKGVPPKHRLPEGKYEPPLAMDKETRAKLATRIPRYEPTGDMQRGAQGSGRYEGKKVKTR